MIEALAKILEKYPGACNRVRCFAHIINLVVKLILRQFDSTKRSKKRSKNKSDAPSDTDDDLQLEEELAAFKEELREHEEERAMDEGEEDDDDLLEEDFEEIELLLKDELARVAEGIKPIGTVLTKVCAPIPVLALYALFALRWVSVLHTCGYRLYALFGSQWALFVRSVCFAFSAVLAVVSSFLSLSFAHSLLLLSASEAFVRYQELADYFATTMESDPQRACRYQRGEEEQHHHQNDASRRRYMVELDL